MTQDFQVSLRGSRPDDREFFHHARCAAFDRYFDPLRGTPEEDEWRTSSDKDFDELPIQIIEQSGSPIGYLCVLHEEDHDFVKEIALVPEAQARGLGSEIICAVIRDPLARNVLVRLSVWNDNPARCLYERLGFRVYGVEGSRIKMEWRPT
jgi:ribosomal protein S18 acetylase RimI-like enzyme